MTMEELLQAITKSYGIIGLFMAAPIVAVVFLWRDNVRLNDAIRAMAASYAERIDSMGQRVVAAQEKRVDDVHGLNTQLVTMISEHAASSKETTIALDRMADMVSMLNAQFNGTMPRRLTGGGT
jgi:hypothetical protein